MHFSLPGSSVYGILQGRILEWVAYPFCRGSSQPRNRTWSPALQADSLPTELWGRCHLYVTPVKKHLWKSRDGNHSCGKWDLVSWLQIEPGPPALKVHSLSHWTTRAVPQWKAAGEWTQWPIEGKFTLVVFILMVFGIINYLWKQKN